MTNSRFFLAATLVTMLSSFALQSSEAGDYKVVEVKNGAVIRGVVSHGGGAQTNEMAGGQGCPPSVTNTDLTIIDGRLVNAVVYLDKVKEGKAFNPRFKRPIADQKSCVFSPHITLVQKGGEVVFQNSDTVLHNVKVASMDNGSFNQGVRAGKELVKSFKKDEFVKVACSVHPWMRSHVVVMQHPYYCATNAKGEYVIADVPPGKYKIKIWHASLNANRELATAVINGKDSGAKRSQKLKKVKAGDDYVIHFAYASGKTNFAAPAVTADPQAPLMLATGPSGAAPSAVVTKPEPAKVEAKPEPAKVETEPEPAKVETKPEPAKVETKPEPAKVEKPKPVAVEKKPAKVEKPKPVAVEQKPAAPVVVVKKISVPHSDTHKAEHPGQHVKVPSVKPLEDPQSVFLLLICIVIIGGVAAPLLLRFGVHDSPLVKAKKSH